MFQFARTAALAAALIVLPHAAGAVVVTVGPGGFDNGYATTITYENDNAIAQRGTSSDRDNPLNALGATDNKFFEIGIGSQIDLTFGTLFDTSATVFEVTNGSTSSWPESADLLVGLGGGAFTFVANISNALAQSGLTIPLGVGVFDTIRLIDTSSNVNPGGFDVDSVRVSPVPLPAGALLLATGLGGLALLRRRKKLG